MLFGTQNRTATSSAEGRRREILAAALRVIAAGGADAVTHRRVASEAKVPLGSLTYYFESREEMIREAFRFYIDEATEFMLEIERNIPMATAADIVELIAEIMRREFMQPEMLRAEYEMILHASRDEQVAKEFAAWERGLEMRLAAPLELLGAERPVAAARTILHLVRGFELEQIAHRAEELGDLRMRLTAVVNALVAPRAMSPIRSQAMVHKRPRRTVRGAAANRASKRSSP
ncbi:MAG TPA: TetR family transcriptional regulator [Candidatus Binataceae bacterium]|nr:TetR family transcriptional regulator [Candidatus Binataceae bacterium]